MCTSGWIPKDTPPFPRSWGWANRLYLSLNLSFGLADYVRPVPLHHDSGQPQEIIHLLFCFIKCSSYCEHYDWSVWVHCSSIKHYAYVTHVHYNWTYARKLRHKNFALDKIWESASPPLWLNNFHSFNSVSNSWTPKKVAALRSLKMRHLFQRKNGLQNWQK